ncbi:hypothetical protein [Actinoplanes sp. NPDC051851]|uniref:Hsp70 family protein n=1 Tax=Actinoplanes sp. NPDC051851 TaxID=3154753 RepID=UPI00343FF632
MNAEARYAIGLDIGDGESCLGWAPLDRSEPTRIYARPRSGERSIVTALAQPPSGTGSRLLGDEAVISRDATHFSVTFKGVPDVLAARTPDAVVFAESLMAEFRECHPEVVREGMAFVGHPSGWPPEAVAAYGRHLAALDLPVRLVPESQSALLHVRDRGRTEGQLERALIIDIGSSTTDFTIVEDLSPRNLPVGASLGCRRIDEQLAALVRDALHHDAALMEALDVDGGPDFLLLACRWAKEAQFSGVPRRIMSLRESCAERFRPIVASAWTWLLDLEIPQLVAAPGGWGEDFRAVLTEVADLLGDGRPHLIVLTGGGSRMPLTDSLCREIFPHCLLAYDEDPAFAVARGLVSNGQHRAAVARFRRDVSDLIGAPETAEVVRTEAALALDTMKDRVAAQMLEARGSAATLANHIRFGMYEAECALAEALVYYLSMRVERICRRHGVPIRHLALDLTLPDLFTDRLDQVLDRAAEVEQLTELSAPAALGQLGFHPGAVHGLLHTAVEAALERVRARLPQPVIPNVAAFAMGVVAGGSGLAADHVARAWILRVLRLGEYTPDELDRITVQVLASITEQTSARARALERWLA